MLLAHSLPEGVANLMIPVAVILALFVVDWKLALLSLASIPAFSVGNEDIVCCRYAEMGPYYAAGQKMNNTIIEYVNGMEVVKVFNRDADSYARLRDDVLAYRDYTLAWYKAAWPWMASIQACCRVRSFSRCLWGVGLCSVVGRRSLISSSRSVWRFRSVRRC